MIDLRKKLINHSEEKIGEKTESRKIPFHSGRNSRAPLSNTLYLTGRAETPYVFRIPRPNNCTVGKTFPSLTNHIFTLRYYDGITHN